MNLRPYQQEAVEAVVREWEGRDKTLLVLPTGCGKTVVFSKVTEERVRRGDRVLILAHRGELLDQAADKLYKVTGLKCAVEKAEETYKSVSYEIKNDKIIFTVVTKAGSFGRIKVTTADNPGGSLGVATTYTVNADGDYGAPWDDSLYGGNGGYDFTTYPFAVSTLVWKPSWLPKQSTSPFPARPWSWVTSTP